MDHLVLTKDILLHNAKKFMKTKAVQKLNGVVALASSYQQQFLLSFFYHVITTPENLSLMIVSAFGSSKENQSEIQKHLNVEIKQMAQINFSITGRSVHYSFAFSSHCQKIS